MVIEKSFSDNLVLHYSDSSMKIVQLETGKIYNEAVDTIPCRYTYSETDIPIEEQE